MYFYIVFKKSYQCRNGLNLDQSPRAQTHVLQNRFPLSKLLVCIRLNMKTFS